MQTILAVACRAAGVVYLGGRLAGEADGAHPLMLPVSPTGPLFLEMRPFGAGYLPLSLRLTLSGGRPSFGEAGPDKRCFAAVWPGGLIELELRPERMQGAAFRPAGEAAGIKVGWAEGRVRCEGEAGGFVHELPEGAGRPEVTPLSPGVLLSGGLPGGEEYAMALSPDASEVLFLLTGRALKLADGGRAVRMLCPAGDIAGHAQLETWSDAGGSWKCVSAEPMWDQGAPVRPSTPEETALAALEAAQLGRMQEAFSYFAPAVPCADVLERAARFDGCTPLRYPLPDGRAAVGLTRLEQGVLHVLPALYTASPGGANGWVLTGMRTEDCA